MGGKSTYLRQVGIIVLLSQIGSFVPAEHAEVGLVDQIFTRVGAGDILWQGRSTFFVEMEETAHLLRKATIRSLVLLDEVGRGTSTYDGLSIAQAVAEYLIEKRIFTLFATHYHELTILQEKKNVSLFTPDLRIHDGRLIFLYQIIPGFHPNSYGIDVAKMAGIPEEIIQRAKEILMEKEDREKRENPHQLTLFSSDPEEILREIETLDPEKMTIGEILSAIKKLKALSRKA
jgi:DNA mismatch repair protein MutS